MKLGFVVFVSILLSILFLLILIQFTPIRMIGNTYPMLLISMDGFRHDYIEKVKANGGKTPNFDYLISSGTRIMRMKNCFPTITLPNHQSLVTGLYPESHGIVLNTFIDRALNNDTFDMNNQDNLNDPKWFEKWPEPIWVTLEKLGRVTASHLWPLTDAPIRGKSPFFQQSQYTYLDNSPSIFNHTKRVDDVIHWLTNGKVGVDFVMLYFEEPDETGHSVGPNDPRLFKVVMELDSVMGHLINQMKAKGIWNKVNIILTADHGMSEDSLSRQIPLDQYVDPSFYTSTLLTPVGALYPVKGKEQAVYQGFKNKNPHLQVYWRHEVPASLNYNMDNGRIAPLILIAENKWAIAHTNSSGTAVYGNHGYNNSEPDVQPFFIAQGPNIRRNFTLPIGNSVDVYNVMCDLLGITPNPNNGSLANIEPMIRNRPNNVFLNCFRFLKMYVLEIAILIMSVSFLLFLIIMFCGAFKKRKEQINGNYFKINDKGYVV